MEALAGADEVVVIGWSIPDTDADQAHLIETALGKRQRPLERVTVINRNASAPYFRRLADVFQVDLPSILIHNSGFVDFASRL